MKKNDYKPMKGKISRKPSIELGIERSDLIFIQIKIDDIQMYTKVENDEAKAFRILKRAQEVYNNQEEIEVIYKKSGKYNWIGA